MSFTSSTTASDTFAYWAFNDVTIIYSNMWPGASTTTTTVEVYGVKPHTTVSSYYVTPVSAKDVASFLPTRRELNRLAAIEGGLALRTKHSRVPKKALILRSSYQGMARLPCYRSPRPR